MAEQEGFKKKNSGLFNNRLRSRKTLKNFFYLNKKFKNLY